MSSILDVLTNIYNVNLHIEFIINVMFSKRKVQNYIIDKQIFKDSLNTYKNYTSNKLTPRTLRLAHDYLLETKCMIQQLKDQIQLEITSSTVLAGMVNQIIKTFRKCSTAQRFQVIFDLLYVCSKVLDLKKIQENIQLFQDCFRLLNDKKRLKQIEELIFADRIDILLYFLKENFTEYFVQWKINYPFAIKNIQSFQESVFRKATKKEGQQIANNFMLLKHEVSKSSLATSSLIKSYNRSNTRKKTSILQNNQNSMTYLTHSLKKGSISGRQSFIGKSLQIKHRRSVRPSLGRNSILMSKKISTRWGNHKQLFRKPSTSSSQQSYKKIKEDFIIDNEAASQDNSSSQSSFLQQKSLIRQIFFVNKQQADIIKSQYFLKQFYMFCQVNRILRMFTVYEIQISKMLGTYKVSFRIKGFFRDKIQFRVDLSKFKLYSPQRLTQDQYRMVIANSIQIQKQFTKFTLNNNSVTNKLNNYNPHKSIVTVKDSNTTKQHFGLHRKINAYFFYKYQIPINKENELVRKFIYDTSLSELYQAQQIQDFKQKDLTLVAEQDQNRYVSEIQGKNFFIQNSDQHQKGKYQYLSPTSQIFGEHILAKKDRIKPNPSILKTIRTNKGKYTIVRQKISQINQNTVKVRIQGFKFDGAKNCHRYQTNIPRQEYSMLQQSQFLNQALKKKIGVHSFKQSKLLPKFQQYFTGKQQKTGFVCYCLRLWSECDYILFIQAYNHSSKKYYLFEVQIEELMSFLQLQLKNKQKFIQKMCKRNFQLQKISKIKLSVESQNKISLQLTYSNKKLNFQGKQLFCLNYFQEKSLNKKALNRIQIVYPVIKSCHQKLIRKLSCSSVNKVHKICRKIIYCNRKLDNLYYEQMELSKLLEIVNDNNFNYASIICRVKKYYEILVKQKKRNTQLNNTHQFYYGEQLNIYRISLCKQSFCLQSIYGQTILQVLQSQIYDSFRFKQKLKGKAKFRYIKRILRDYQ